MSATDPSQGWDDEPFDTFFRSWIAQQDRYLQQLRNLQTHHLEEDRLRPLIDAVVRHYEQYYRHKSRSVKHDVLRILSPTWISTLEDAFLWVGGWRPSMSFHLFYSKSGIQFETQLGRFLDGVGFESRDLGELSPAQLNLADELQKKTIREERRISENMAEVQETVADSKMVELSHAVTEMRATGREVSNGGICDAVEGELKRKKQAFEKVVEEADGLRLSTLKGLLEILTPVQAVHFLISAAELHLRLHEWGEKADGRRSRH